jgi:hypothetical protein
MSTRIPTARDDADDAEHLRIDMPQWDRVRFEQIEGYKRLFEWHWPGVDLQFRVETDPATGKLNAKKKPQHLYSIHFEMPVEAPRRRDASAVPPREQDAANAPLVEIPNASHATPPEPVGTPTEPVPNPPVPPADEEDTAEEDEDDFPERMLATCADEQAPATAVKMEMPAPAPVQKAMMPASYSPSPLLRRKFPLR